MDILTFCVVVPLGYVANFNQPVINSALTEIAALRGQTANILIIESGYPIQYWRWYPYQALQSLRLPKPYVCLVPGMGGFAGSYAGGFAVLGDWALWALNWGDDNIISRDYPYWGIYLNRRSQMGAIRHEADHATCDCGVADPWHNKGVVPWWKLFN